MSHQSQNVRAYRRRDGTVVRSYSRDVEIPLERLGRAISSLRLRRSQAGNLGYVPGARPRLRRTNSAQFTSHPRTPQANGGASLSATSTGMRVIDGLGNAARDLALLGIRGSSKLAKRKILGLWLHILPEKQLKRRVEKWHYRHAELRFAADEQAARDEQLLETKTTFFVESREIRDRLRNVDDLTAEERAQLGADMAKLEPRISKYLERRETWEDDQAKLQARLDQNGEIAVLLDAERNRRLDPDATDEEGSNEDSIPVGRPKLSRRIVESERRAIDRYRAFRSADEHLWRQFFGSSKSGGKQTSPKAARSNALSDRDMPAKIGKGLDRGFEEIWDLLFEGWNLPTANAKH